MQHDSTQLNESKVKASLLLRAKGSNSEEMGPASKGSGSIVPTSRVGRHSCEVSSPRQARRNREKQGRKKNKK